MKLTSQMPSSTSLIPTVWSARTVEMLIFLRCMQMRLRAGDENVAIMERIGEVGQKAGRKCYPCVRYEVSPMSRGSGIFVVPMRAHVRLHRTKRASRRSRHVGPSIGGIDRSWIRRDRKSTRLNSSHEWNSYAVFCLKKKKVVPNETYTAQDKDKQKTGHRENG